MKIRINAPIVVTEIVLKPGYQTPISVKEAQLYLEPLDGSNLVYLGKFDGYHEITVEKSYVLTAHNTSGKIVSFVTEKQARKATIQRDEISYTSLDMPRPVTEVERMLLNQQEQINRLMASKEKGPKNVENDFVPERNGDGRNQEPETDPSTEGAGETETDREPEVSTETGEASRS